LLAFFCLEQAGAGSLAAKFQSSGFVQTTAFSGSTSNHLIVFDVPSLILEIWSLLGVEDRLLAGRGRHIRLAIFGELR